MFHFIYDFSMFNLLFIINNYNFLLYITTYEDFIDFSFILNKYGKEN